MEYAIVGSYSLDDILTALARGRAVYALEADERGRYRMVQASNWEPSRHVLGAYRPTEPLKSLFFRPREYLGTWQSPPREAPLAECIVSAANGSRCRP